MYVCIYVLYVYMYISIYVYMYIYVYIYMYIMYICIYVYMHTGTDRILEMKEGSRAAVSENGWGPKPRQNISDIADFQKK